MFEVSIPTALLLYLGVFLFICLGTWLTSHLRQRKKEILPPLYLLTTCEYCAHAYLSLNGESVSKCPMCESFNRSE